MIMEGTPVYRDEEPLFAVVCDELTRESETVVVRIEQLDVLVGIAIRIMERHKAKVRNGARKKAMVTAAVAKVAAARFREESERIGRYVQKHIGAIIENLLTLELQVQIRGCCVIL